MHKIFKIYLIITIFILLGFVPCNAAPFQSINVVAPGDNLPTAFTKVNNNFIEVETRITRGVGSPEMVVTAPVGSLYVDTATGFVYRKVSGVGDTGWKLLTEWIDARGYNSGATTDATLTAAITALGTTPKYLLLDDSIWTISNDVTIPSNITVMMLPGTTINIAAGKTLTMAGDIIAPDVNIFGGSGSISLTNAAVKAKGKWFGMICDGVTDNSVALQRGVNASVNIELPTGSCKVSTTKIDIPSTLKVLEGVSMSSSKIVYSKAQSTPSYANDSLFIIPQGHDGLTIKDFELEYTGTYSPAPAPYGGYVAGIYIEDSDNITIENVNIHGFNNSGIVIGINDTDYSTNIKVLNCKLHNNRVAGVLFGYTQAIEIAGNELYSNGVAGSFDAGSGIMAWTTTLPKDSFIHDNYSYTNLHAGIQIQSGDSGVIDSNIVKSNYAKGIVVNCAANKECGDWIISNNSVQSMANDGYPIYGIEAGSPIGQGVGCNRNTFIIKGNSIKDFKINAAGTAVAYPFYFEAQGMTQGVYILESNTVYNQSNSITSFIDTPTDASVANKGNFFDLSLINNSFYATDTNDSFFPLGIRSAYMRHLVVDNNYIQVFAGTSVLNLLNVTSALTNRSQSYTNNHIVLVNGVAWVYDPFLIERTHPNSIMSNNFFNGHRMRDWDGYRYITWSTAAPAADNWTVGSECINITPVEAGAALSKYIIRSWLNTAAGAPGTWLESRTLTGN